MRLRLIYPIFTSFSYLRWGHLIFAPFHDSNAHSFNFINSLKVQNVPCSKSVLCKYSQCLQFLFYPTQVHSVSKLLKMSHLKFRTLAFPQIVELVLTCLVTLFDRKLQLASLAMLNETFSMIFKHAVRTIICRKKGTSSFMLHLLF